MVLCFSQYLLCCVGLGWVSYMCILCVCLSLSFYYIYLLVCAALQVDLPLKGYLEIYITEVRVLIVVVVEVV